MMSNNTISITLKKTVIEEMLLNYLISHGFPTISEIKVTNARLNPIELTVEGKIKL